MTSEYCGGYINSTFMDGASAVQNNILQEDIQMLQELVADIGVVSELIFI